MPLEVWPGGTGSVPAQSLSASQNQARATKQKVFFLSFLYVYVGWLLNYFCRNFQFLIHSVAELDPDTLQETLIRIRVAITWKPYFPKNWKHILWPLKIIKNLNPIQVGGRAPSSFFYGAPNMLLWFLKALVTFPLYILRTFYHLYQKSWIGSG